MIDPTAPRRLSKPQIASMIAIDLVALLIGLYLFSWLRSRDLDAAILALVSSLVFGGFFNLVIVLVSLKP
jgi:hypothetical protein